MAMYKCNKCDEWMDDDYHPCAQDVRTPSGLDLVCPDCEAEINEDIDAAHAVVRAQDEVREFATAVEKQVREKGSVSNKTIVEGK